MQVENVEMAIRRALRYKQVVVQCVLSFIKVKKKHALKRALQRQNPIKLKRVQLGTVWWALDSVKQM